MLIEFINCYTYFYSHQNGVCCTDYKMAEGVCQRKLSYILHWKQKYKI